MEAPIASAKVSHGVATGSLTAFAALGGWTSVSSSAEQLCQLPRVPTIGLDPIAGLHRDQRRRDDLAFHPQGLQLALERVPARPGLLAARDAPRGLGPDLLHHPPNRRLLVRHLPLDQAALPRRELRYRDRVLVRVQPHVR